MSMRWDIYFPVGVCLLMASVLVGFSLHDWYRDQMIRRTWVDQEAKVTKVDAFESKGLSDRRESFQGEVNYAYQRDGKSFDGLFRSSALTPMREDALTLVAPYPVGATIQIKINPKNVSESALLNVEPAFDSPMFIVGSIVGLIGILLLLRGGHSDEEVGIRRLVNDRFMAFFIAFLLTAMFGYGVGSRLIPWLFWKSAHATVEEAKIVTSYDNGYLYSVAMRWTYQYDGKPFTGFFESDRTNSAVESDRLLERYSKGAPIEIKVDPKHPQKSTLGQVSFSWVMLGGFVIALGFLLMAGYSWVSGWVRGGLTQ